MMGAVESLRGKLLIAASNLFDLNFRRTVVLVGHHDEEGAVGVVLNRVTDVLVADAVPTLADLVPPGDRVFVGGPVQPEAAVVVAEFEEPGRAGVLAFDRVGFLAQEVEPEDTAAVRRARVFAGYAGWGPGQLEAELEEESWVVEPARLEDAFSEDPERLWDAVLRRKGPSYDLLRLMPLDPSEN
jgi:putative transcriptional regulator